MVLADLVEPIQHRAAQGRTRRTRQRTLRNSRYRPHAMPTWRTTMERWLQLELKLIADVGIVGVPNAGKSTLLSVVSNAKPKIANYPFTTLEPNLGVVEYDDLDLVFADIPGLIEGAHLGVGLGHEFLRHVQRTRVLIHMINGDSEDPIADFSQINSELALFDERMERKPQIVAFNKIDLPDVQARWELLKPKFEALGVEAMPISAAAQINVRELIGKTFAVVSQVPKDLEPLHVVQPDALEPKSTDVPFTIELDVDGVYHVRGHRIERAAEMTHWDNDEAIMRFQNILEVLGVSKALEAKGVKVGDTVFIGGYELEWSD